MGAVARIKEYFSCTCGELLSAGWVFVECPKCKQRWRSSGGGGWFEAAEAPCPTCDGLGIHLNPSAPLKGYTQPPTLERCDTCRRFFNDDAALNAVAEAWKIMHNTARTAVDSCRVCPFIDDTHEHCKMLHSGVTPYALCGNIEKVDVHCPLRRRSQLVQLDEKVKGEEK